MTGRIERIRVFVKVAELNGFAAAARELGVTRSIATRYVSELEGELGAQLLVRTTRKVSTTVAGRLYLERMQTLLADLDRADELINQQHATLSGELRLSAPVSFGQRFLPRVLAEFRERAPSDKWHLDEVVISIRGRKHWLWRAIDANGDVLEILMQSRRNGHAAKRFLMKLMKRWGVPRVLVTDKLRSYGVAVRGICPSVDHRSHKGLKNRSEASHRHTRRREKVMGRFKSPRQAQQFLSVHDQTATIFRPKRHRLSAASYRHARADAFSLWNSYAAEMSA